MRMLETHDGIHQCEDRDLEPYSQGERGLLAAEAGQELDRMVLMLESSGASSGGPAGLSRPGGGMAPAPTAPGAGS